MAVLSSFNMTEQPSFQVTPSGLSSGLDQSPVFGESFTNGEKSMADAEHWCQCFEVDPFVGGGDVIDPSNPTSG